MDERTFEDFAESRIYSAVDALESTQEFKDLQADIDKAFECIKQNVSGDSLGQIIDFQDMAEHRKFLREIACYRQGIVDAIRFLTV